MVQRYVRSRRRGAVGWMRRLVVVTSCLADAGVRLLEEIASYNRSMCVWRWRLVTSFIHATNSDYGSLLFISWEAATIHLPASCNIFLRGSKLGCCSGISIVERHSSAMPSLLVSSYTLRRVVLWLKSSYYIIS